MTNNFRTLQELLFTRFMRKLKLAGIAVSLMVFCVFLSCKKETKIVYQNAVADSSHLSITNASPVVSNLLFYVSNQLISLPDSPFYYGSTSFATYVSNINQVNPVTRTIPYINIPYGYQQLGFGSPLSNNLFVSMNNYFAAGGNYSVFITDTINHGQLKGVLLQDNVGPADTSNGQIRFLNLSPDAPALDLWAFPNAGANGYKIFSGCDYLPNDYSSVVKAQSFLPIPVDPYYFVATEAGTNNIVLEGGLIIPPRSVVTIYAKGFVGGTGGNAIDVGVILYKQ
jgi:hypothetical protein